MMRCILVFDQLNDLLYINCDRKFSKHVRKLGQAQGLIPEGEDDVELSPDVIIQLFSPIVTSQRIMSCQFGNSYSSVQCKDGTNMVFDEYMGYLFVNIGTSDVTWLKRMLGICITIVKHLCGPDVSLLKSNSGMNLLLTRLLDSWLRLQDSDQAVLVEAVEQLMVNADLSGTTMKSLQEATDRLKSQTDFSHIHTLVLVENKFLSLYSSRNAQDLSSPDIMFLSLLCDTLRSGGSDVASSDGTESETAGDSSGDEYYSPQRTPRASPKQPRREATRMSPLAVQLEKLRAGVDGINSRVVLLTGNGTTHTPHAVHIGTLEDGVFLLIIFETGNGVISSGLYESLDALNTIQSVQLQKDQDGVKHAFENLDAGIKKVFEGLKKNRYYANKPEVENCQRKLHNKWDFLRKKYVEYMKTLDLDCVVRIESITAGFADTLKELLNLTCLNTEILTHGRDAVFAVVATVRSRLTDFSNFLKVKALRNFTLGSRASLTINKYLEEFPGLVHFLYVDRSNHRITAPSLDFSSEETISLTKKKIWSMVAFARAHLQEGHLAIIWKDTTFNYAYFLWFEDTSGSPLKPKVFPTVLLKNLPIPGIMCGDFYQKLVETCFPKTSPSKVRCYELYCIHLGLATSSCVLEHSRRLAATIWEVTGIPNNPVDLL